MWTITVPLIYSNIIKQIKIMKTILVTILELIINRFDDYNQDFKKYKGL